MTDGRGSEPQNGFLPKVVYNRDAPSSVFSQRQIDYVESIAAFLSPVDLEKVRRVEWLLYNPNSSGYGSCFIPGLRGDIGFDGLPSGFVYFKRFSDIYYPKLISIFLDHEPASFPNLAAGLACRVTVS